MAKKTVQTKTELKIQRIKNGTVLDHLPAGSALNVLRILGINKNYKNTVAIAMNVSSKKIGVKDVLKLEDRILRPEETDKLALIAPAATINIIRDYEVIKKDKVSVPKDIIGVLKCENPACITNNREPVSTVFTIERENPIILRCKFCERIMDKDLIERQL